MTEVDKVNAFGQVVERDFIGSAPRVLSSYPSSTVVAGARTLPTTVLGASGVTEVDRANAFGQVVERDFVGGASRVYSSPTTVLPPTTVYGGYGGFPSSTIVGAPGVTEVDKVNAFGQVVERDFVGAAPQVVERDI